MGLERTIHAVIHPGEQSGYVAECPLLHAVTQGASLDEVAKNLREAIALALQDEDLSEIGLAPNPVVVVSFELEPLVA